ncbi:MAG: SDR family NAD(P)-dependent oxidoreductase, partial [Gammaproteobacteria bacterium]|nr:SDR family NAD(P)-dependent oxidoreductase [Gammaproteobacteria bacterium]
MPAWSPSLIARRIIDGPRRMRHGSRAHRYAVRFHVAAKRGSTMATDEHGAQDNAHPDLGVFAGGVAVVTGGASGIGLALVEKAIASGMHAVIADIEIPAIDEAESRLADAASARGVEVFGHRADVSSEADVLDLEMAVSARFPDSPVSLLCCNAGVGGGGPVSRASDIDWDFVLGVNVKGVAN